MSLLNLFHEVPLNRSQDDGNWEDGFRVSGSVQCFVSSGQGICFAVLGPRVIRDRKLKM